MTTLQVNGRCDNERCGKRLEDDVYRDSEGNVYCSEWCRDE